MDSKRFDALTQVLAGSSRRNLLAAVRVTALSAFLGLGAHETTAKKKCRCNGKTCGCKGKCGTCGQDESCKKGQCVPDGGGCTPSCVGKAACANDGCGQPCETCDGGQTCQTGQCTCPAARPHAAPEQFCPVTCVECCIDAHCHPTKHCDHNQGSICVCTGEGHKDCGQGFCSQCCTTEDCIVNHNWSDGVTCTTQGLCRCGEGLTICDGDPKYCANLRSDSQNCGQCGKVCNNGTSCSDGICQ